MSDRILNKPGRLDHVEVLQMQAHLHIGCNIFERLPVLREISTLVLYHHEHFVNIRHLVPGALDKFEKKEISHIAFVGHEELMHSRKLL